jgi:hypothetical protein
VNDKDVLERIQNLVDEEHTLLEEGEKKMLSDDERARLEALEINLDQCWDLLRQRRALRNAGEDPDHAHTRDPSTVERYQQ